MIYILNKICIWLILFVIASAKTHDFNYLVEHSLSHTLEKDFDDMSSGRESVFRTINEMIDVRCMRLH